MARAATSRNNWLFDKKVTYHRSAKSERGERIREAKAQRREQKAAEARRRRELLVELKDDAFEAGRSDRYAGRKGSPYRISLIVSPRWEEAFGKGKARSLVLSAYKQGYRRNPETCARTVKAKVTDRAKRYRANQPGCRPNGKKQCKLCKSRSDVMVDHVDGNESNGKKSNLRWLCRSCNNTLGAEMAKAGHGRRTVQYNPAKKGAQNLYEYIQAVLQHTRGSHDAAGKIIHETPKSKRREYAEQIWAARGSHGTTHPGSGRTGQDEPDWVTNPANPSADSYWLVLYDGLSKRGNKHHFAPGNLDLAQRKAQEYADDMGLDAVLYGPDGRMLGRFTTARPHSWRNPAESDNPSVYTLTAKTRRGRAVTPYKIGISPTLDRAMEQARNYIEAGETIEITTYVDGKKKRVRLLGPSGWNPDDQNPEDYSFGGESSKDGANIRKIAAWAKSSFAVAAAAYSASGGNLMKATAIAKKEVAKQSRQNPEDSEEYRQAKKIAELFHGRPVKEEITVTEHIREHDWLWRIGPLVSLKIRTVTKRNATLPFDQSEEGMVHLFCSPDGRQFYLRGGDQELNLEALDMGPGSPWYRDHMLIGEAKEITYRDKKKFHKFKLVDYYHKLGEETKKKPTLAYDAFAHKMQIVGGQYRIETKDLVDGMSPGIVN